MGSIYATLDQLKSRLGLRTTDSRDDEALEGFLEATSRAIDSYCGTRFYIADTPEVRYYTANTWGGVLIDDLVSLTSLATDTGEGTYSTSWLATDYTLMPTNAALDGRPYWQIVTALGGTQTFSRTARGVKVTGAWGYSASVPKLVETVCLRESLYQFQANTTPYGMTAGDGAVSTPPQVGLHPRSLAMLAEFKRIVLD